MDTWQLIDAERTDFADLCDSLTPAQWDTTTLCDKWRVRDVVAHVTEGATMTFGRALSAIARYRFRVGVMLEQEAIRGGAASPDELRRDLRATVGVRRTPPGVKPAGVLADEVIHQQDVRRVLGSPRRVDEDRLRTALDETKDTRLGLLPGKKRVAGLHLQATDIDWATGEPGRPEVRGPGEALLLAIAGRTVALADLTGAGVDTLRARI
ncbi:MAG: maleylpyruvate isomerase family mycothiol-dependent enzyme [Acidimicrobiia bacterium]